MKRNLSDVLESRRNCYLKGWMNTKDICECVPCSYRKAKEIRDEIEKEISLESFENLRGCILSERFFKYMHLTKEEVLKGKG